MSFDWQSYKLISLGTDIFAKKKVIDKDFITEIYIPCDLYREIFRKSFKMGSTSSTLFVNLIPMQMGLRGFSFFLCETSKETTFDLSFSCS